MPALLQPVIHSTGTTTTKVRATHYYYLLLHTIVTRVHTDRMLSIAKPSEILLSLLLQPNMHVHKHYDSCKSLNFTSCCSLMRSTLALSYASDMPRAALLLLLLVVELSVSPRACISPAQPFLRPKFAANTRLCSRVT
jgi:hypothetical protein